MNNKERIKLNIERLKDRSDFYKWEYGQYTNYFIGIIAILIALFIPTILEIKMLFYKLLLAFLLIISFLISYKIINFLSKDSSNKIIELSKEIENNYNRLERL
jgi:hypothetical protein